MSKSNNLNHYLPKRILSLDISVVSKIAAGEVIQRPSNALKELIENSVDAGATSIDILVEGGGLKLLQVSDNGHGIMKEDLSILCERFTTSKLRTFEDLSSISTYGFRGEALASISHISYVTVITKTSDSSCAWKANYLNGKLVSPKEGESSDPKPAAGRQGTQIVIKDLFYNIPSRLKSFRSSNDEYIRILDVIYRYAVHCEKIGFSCKNYGEIIPSITTSSKSTVIENIKQLYGAAISSELLPFSLNSQDYMFQAKGFFTSVSYSAKKTTFLLFINRRSVDCKALKRGLESIYKIESSRVDVNIHPTKREVRFFYEDEIINLICKKVHSELSRINSSKTISLQTVKAKSCPLNYVNETLEGGKKIYDRYYVRTDAKFQTITSILNNVETSAMKKIKRNNSKNFTDFLYQVNDKEKIIVRLTSIKELRDEVIERRCDALTNIFINHIFVGIVDEEKQLAAIQHSTELYFVDYGSLSFELFYQIGLAGFANFGIIRLEPELSLIELLEMLPKSMIHDSTFLKNLMDVSKIIIGFRQMLYEYFSLGITSDGKIYSLPLLLKGYIPNIGKLPLFIYRLCIKVNWNKEKECFCTFLRELALFHLPDPLFQKRNKFVLFPAFKKRLIGTVELLEKKKNSTNSYFV
ncbi:unnamed protein product [Pneumocystis jirovecii]|uniref:DNA mismatch repair protein S5 domain-containing protein n=1 Tax=Pneumocystis jirovecii TaxID=42068 RepID=L0PG96_PNEJI|nr:unnamed protein product [Pneumocystis jirovecii]